MKLAYVILCFKNFQQVQRMIDRLDDPQSHFLIAVDANSPDKPVETLRKSLANRPNITFAPRSKIQWGKFSAAAAFRDGVASLLQAEVMFDYVFLMSGQDYPLVKPDQIRQKLKDSGGRSFLLHEPFPVKMWEPLGMGRMYSWNFFYGRNVYQFPKWAPANRRWVQLIYAIINRIVPRRGKFPLALTPYGGSPHSTLSREAAEYALRFAREHPEYDRRFRFTLHSDEVYFQTILANSPLKGRLINNDLRYLVWPSSDAASPIVLTAANLPGILASGALFARKFDVSVDAKVLDLIDKHVDQA